MSVDIWRVRYMAEVKTAGKALPGKEAKLKKDVTLVARLAANDFKTKYAGSYLGIIWAFVQPVVTIFVYWFVFSTIRSGNVRSVPFVLWLMAGLIPWFYFQDSLNAGTSSLIEYSYLVKKIVFNIDILPVVKLVSSLFVHVFFLCVLIVIYLVSGHFPGIYVLQIPYYSAAMFCLVLGIVYLTSAVVVFFRDLTQIINIALQVGVWMTPIMWNFDDLHISGKLMYVFKANPMFYIVDGMRDAMINKVWFWEKPGLTLYFWLFTVIVFLLGRRVFGRLKVHFADVL